MSTSRIVKNTNLQNIPAHIAIIMDGNGRWAKKKGLPRFAGHWAGAEALREIIKTSVELKIKTLSVFAFSSENWKRPVQEVEAILNLLLYYLKKEINTLHKNNIKIVVTGNWKELPERIVVEINKNIQITQDNSGLILNVVLNYGARNEITQACKEICKAVLENKLTIESITEEIFKEYLYTRDLSEPDLLIRPSGEQRISNFLLWQIAYTELWFTDIYWPDFKSKDLLKAIYDFQQRERRFGGLKQ